VSCSALQTLPRCSLQALQHDSQQLPHVPLQQQQQRRWRLLLPHPSQQRRQQQQQQRPSPQQQQQASCRLP
jgi:hypothetical protein